MKKLLRVLFLLLEKINNKIRKNERNQVLTFLVNKKNSQINFPVQIQEVDLNQKTRKKKLLLKMKMIKQTNKMNRITSLNFLRMLQNHQSLKNKMVNINLTCQNHKGKKLLNNKMYNKINKIIHNLNLILRIKRRKRN